MDAIIWNVTRKPVGWEAVTMISYVALHLKKTYRLILLGQFVFFNCPFTCPYQSVYLHTRLS
jgi:hypothetical protein